MAAVMTETKNPALGLAPCRLSGRDAALAQAECGPIARDAGRVDLIGRVVELAGGCVPASVDCTWPWPGIMVPNCCYHWIKELLKAAKIPCHAGLWSTLKIRRVSGIAAESRQENQYGNGFTGTQEAGGAKHLAG